MPNQALAIQNLAYRYAKDIILRRPAAKFMTPKEITAAARSRVNRSLLALAKVNLNRRAATHPAPKAVQ